MNEVFPPPNFIPAPSTVEGIEVYIPTPPLEEAHREIVDFKCPQCGATTAYSVADGGLTCTYCGYYEPSKKDIVGKGAEEFEFKVETMERAVRGWGQARKELQCQNCGAATSLPPEMLTYTCLFCGSNKVIQREAPQDVLRPRFLVPFKIEPNGCQKIGRAWLRTSWMTPASLRRLAQFGGFSPIYLPFWTFDAYTRADWRAEIAHTKTERYHSGGKWKTRTVTKWKWESGHAELDIDDLLIEGTSRLSDILLDRIRDHDLSHLVPFEPEYLAGLQAQAYEISLDKAWEAARKKMREMTKHACRGQASGPRIRNLCMTIDFEKETWRYILLPIYVATYRFENRTFQVLVNGQTGTIAGQRPVSWFKVGLASAAVLAPGLLLGFAAAIALFFGGMGLMIGSIAAIVLLMGAGMVVKWVQEAMRMDDA